MQNIFPLELFAIYFSPHSAHAILVDGVLYPTLEHAYQASRYTDPKIREEIRNAKSPLLAWKISSGYKHLQIEAFKEAEYKLMMMKKLMELKLEQHEDVRKALNDSKDFVIVKHITNYPPADGFWDDGEDSTGLNHIGRLWMELREENPF